jgi:LEA14-like dessication related protein
MTVSRPARRPVRWVVGCSALLLAGCASMEPPSITLTSLQGQPSTLFEQRFITNLRIQNPNDFDLPLEGLSFDIVVNDQPFAKGVGRTDTVIPAFGSGVVQAEAVTTLMSFVRQVQMMGRGGGPKLSYAVTGKLKVRDRMTAIPFEMRGDDLLQLQRPKDRRDE